jgi:outer membrane protein OmpA-like peptidoglycan-associated protein
MTRFHGLSIVTFGAALSMTAGLAFAGDTVSADKILDALKPKAATRGLSTGPQVDTAAQAKEASFVDTLRNRKTRSLSLGEREEIAELAATKPKIDLEIRFDYNSADIAKTSVQAVQELGKALSDASLKGSTFVVAGHTDAAGDEAYNQDLSERRADSIKRYLTGKYSIAAADLVTVRALRALHVRDPEPEGRFGRLARDSRQVEPVDTHGRDQKRLSPPSIGCETAPALVDGPVAVGLVCEYRHTLASPPSKIRNKNIGSQVQLRLEKYPPSTRATRTTRSSGEWTKVLVNRRRNLCMRKGRAWRCH